MKLLAWFVAIFSVFGVFGALTGGFAGGFDFIVLAYIIGSGVLAYKVIRPDQA